MADAQVVDRRKFGKYYTPNEATQVLCSWAIRDAADLLLEPSFGACGFLAASRRRLEELECSNPALQLFGCDIDDDAFYDHLLPLFFDKGVADRFLDKDFLAIQPEAFPHRFSAVIGNPPYISNQRMSAQQKKNLALAFADGSHNISGRADLWVYFVLHSLRFLEVGGRMAWILPGSFLQANYAAPVRRAIEAGFGRAIAIQLGQKLFVSEGAKENTVVVLADGWQQGTCLLGIEYAPTLEELETLIRAWDSGDRQGLALEGTAQAALLPLEVQQCMAEVASRFRVKLLGDICTIRIGIVTGANQFFVLTRDQAQQHGLDDRYLRPIVSKFSMVPGLSLTTDDLDAAVDEGFNCLLVETRGLNLEQEEAMREYLATFDAERREDNCTFKKRLLWHQPNDGNTPHAFLSYMHEHGPRLALNTAGTTSTNTVHRAYFQGDAPLVERQSVAIALASVFAQLSAEIEGRAYGSGVLKHEPSGAKKIQLLMPRNPDAEATAHTFHEIDRLQRTGDSEGVQRMATHWAFADVVQQQGEVEARRIQGILEVALGETRRKRHHPPLSAQRQASQ